MKKKMLLVVFLLVFAIATPAMAQNSGVYLAGRVIDRGADIAISVHRDRVWERVNRDNNDTAIIKNDRQATSIERTASIYTCGQIMTGAMHTGNEVPEFCGTPSSGITLSYRQRTPVAGSASDYRAPSRTYARRRH